MSIEKAVSMPKQKAIRYPYQECYLTIAEIAEIENIPEYLIRKHIPIKQSIPKVLDYIKHKYYDSNGERLHINGRHGMEGTPEHNAWKKS